MLRLLVNQITTSKTITVNNTSTNVAPGKTARLRHGERNALTSAKLNQQGASRPEQIARFGNQNGRPLAEL